MRITIPIVNVLIVINASIINVIVDNIYIIDPILINNEENTVTGKNHLIQIPRHTISR
jgi:hypothetical protein